MTYIPDGINTVEISNNDLFARKPSSRIDLDLFCVKVLTNSLHSAKANIRKAIQLFSRQWYIRLAGIKYLDLVYLNR